MHTIIHIGTQKTGSKAIQTFLANQVAAIPGQIVCFPRAGREGGWHQPMCHDLRRGEAGSLRRAVEEARAGRADAVVLSCEIFYRLPSPAIELLRETVGEARIVLFLRRQDQLVDSLYNQFIKAHRVSFARIEAFETEIGGRPPEFDHLATIERWANVFGAASMLPIVYDKSRGAVETFLEHVGLPLPPGWSDRDEPNPNPALDAAGLATLRRAKKLNEQDGNLPRLVDAAHVVLRDRFVDTYREGDVAVLSRLQRRALLDRYRQSNEQIRRTFFPESPALFTPGFEAAEEDPREWPGPGIAERAVDMALVEAIYREAGLDLRGPP